ncbi:MAG: Asp-tRNA(Asn)/Glu-tRNA(Gln) amidotransferase subunit GatA [Ignavibacteriales bacterium]|nr:Asp-tRNA(Asn)/Glu-tRNA(Gln) amidotransferase subunit GatA [Ignavibacteriales bacterium]
MPYSSISEKKQLILSGKLDLIQNINFFLNKIEENKNLNSFLFVNPRILEEAQQLLEKVNGGLKPGSLFGAVIAIKDVISVEGMPMTCGSKILEDFHPVYDATVISKLREEHALIMGKLNCDEFAMGSSNENSAYGNVLNPVDQSRVPGGSSGGSAAAVAADLCDVALGSDTGGSIRQPAAFCGVYGIKPTYSRVSRYGLTAFASSFDSIGPLAKNHEDCALVLGVISGYDAKDSTSTDSEVPVSIGKKTDNPNFRIGLPKEYFGEGLNSEIRDSIQNLVKKLKDSGNIVEEVSLPNTHLTIAAYYVLTTAEAASNLSRYDGVRFGKRSNEDKSLGNLYAGTRSKGFGKEVKGRIMLGNYVLSGGYYDAYFNKAQKVRRLIKSDFSVIFKDYDLILTPVTPELPFKFGEMSDDPLSMYLGDIYTTSVNLAGLPAISIPAGKSKEGLPLAVQFIAPEFEENKLFRIADILQKL